MLPTNLKFSCSPNFHNKDQLTIEAYSNEFHPLEASLDELAELISEGFAFSYQFEGGVRKSSNFICSDFLAVDIDGGTTIEEALQNSIVKDFASLLYATPNHSVDCHRFRVVFALERTLVDARELCAAARSLTLRLKGDPSATDAARIFFGSAGSTPQIFGKFITNEFLDELTADGCNKPISDSINQYAPTTNRSRYILNENLRVTTSEGVTLSLNEITVKTTIICPFHNDTKPSAFVNRTHNGQYIFCSKCNSTRWVSNRKIFDFNGFENAVRDVKENPKLKREYRNQEFADFLGLNTHLDATNIHFSADKYLQMNSIVNGITFIKSPKGTGKTHFLAEALKEIIFVAPNMTLSVLEETSDPDVPDPIYTQKRVLLIGHRQALIRELCHKLSLNCYLDDPKNNHDEVSARKRRYGVCLDSLRKVKDEKYDVIILDEVEQVLSHFLSDTIGSTREELFIYLTKLLENAKSIVALDADLGWLSFMTITELANGKKQFSNVLPVNIHINSHISKQRSFKLYVTAEHLINQLQRDILDNKKIFITSNSKKQILALTQSIAQLSNELASPIKTLTITSENSGETHIQRFIKNIKTEILSYQVVLCSPSLGTGIDITFPDESSEIDAVYGFFANRINSHTEIDQQLARVRNPREIHVWVSHETYDFETDFEVIREEQYEDSLNRNIYAQQYAYASQQNSYHPFVTMCSLIVSNQRASKNNLRQNFIAHKKNEGWSIQFINYIPEEAKLGKEFYVNGKLALEDADIRKILDSPPMDRPTMEDYLSRKETNDGEVSSHEKASYYRTKLELFYQLEISEDLVRLDNHWQFQQTVLAYEAIINRDRILRILNERGNNAREAKVQRALEQIISSRSSAYLLIYGLLEKTPFFESGVFNESVSCSREELKDFAKSAHKNSVYVETHLELPTRNDVIEKPVMHLNKILAKVGLKVLESKTQQARGTKTRFYKLDPALLDRMREITNRRAETVNDWKFVNNLHGFNWQ